MIAAHLGIVEEDKIDNMSYLFFETILTELGKKLNYDAVVNYAGNSFAKDSWKLIQENNPFASEKKTGEGAVASFFAGANVQIHKAGMDTGDIAPKKEG